MSVKLGKRKRVQPGQRAVEKPPTPSEDEREDFQEIFRKAFEKKFKPLDESVKIPRKENVPEEQSESDEETDWEGLESNGEDEVAVLVVEATSVQTPEELSKIELKAFMQSKPPLANIISKPVKSKKVLDPEDEKAESLNLKNDLALHRLISESHLLSKTPASNHRSKIIDMRLQSLGSKTSFLQQEKMPLSHRKGIMVKTAKREERRRKEAKENGIVLEKEKRPKVKREIRVRGVGGPSVGKFKGGMLTLSRKDVDDIRGPPRKQGDFKKKGKR